MNQHLLEELTEAGCLDPAEARTAILSMRRALPWAPWANRMLLGLGATLVLNGVVMFFASNWNGLDKFARLGLVAGGLVACVAAANLRRLRDLPAKWLLLAACVLVGVFRGVVESEYNSTEAGWVFFASWAALILPWALLGEAAPIWLLWLALLDLAVGQHLEKFDCFMVVAAINVAAVCAREVGCGLSWLRAGWIRIVLLMASVAPLTLACTLAIIDHRAVDVEQTLLSCGMYAVGLGVSWYYFYRLRRDLSALFIVVLGACIVALTLLGRWIFADSDQITNCLYFGLASLLLCSAVAKWLRSLARRLAEVEA